MIDRKLGALETSLSNILQLNQRAPHSAHSWKKDSSIASHDESTRMQTVSAKSIANVTRGNI